MRNKKTFKYLALSLILILVLSGCGAKDKEEAKQAGKEQSTKKQESKTQAKKTTASKEKEAEKSDAGDDALAARAKKEGISVDELNGILEDLVKLTAYKYGKTPDEIKAGYKADGKTVFEVYSTAADVMGLTMEEYFDAEEDSVMSMSEEQLAQLRGMAEAGDAIKEAMDNRESAEGSGQEMIEVDLKKIAIFEPEMVMGEELADPANGGVTYLTKASIEEVRDYYKGILENTKDFRLEYDKSMNVLNVSGVVNDDIVVTVSVLDQTVVFAYSKQSYN